MRATQAIRLITQSVQAHIRSKATQLVKKLFSYVTKTTTGGVKVHILTASNSSITAQTHQHSLLLLKQKKSTCFMKQLVTSLTCLTALVGQSQKLLQLRQSLSVQTRTQTHTRTFAFVVRLLWLLITVFVLSLALLVSVLLLKTTTSAQFTQNTQSFLHRRSTALLPSLL